MTKRIDPREIGGTGTRDATTFLNGNGVWAAPASGGSGGGGSSSVGPSPDDIPASPSMYDYEFNATSTALPAGWSWVNQGSSTYDEDHGIGATYIATSASGDEWRAIVRSIPTAPSFTAKAKVTMLATHASNLYPSKGLVLRESATGKMLVLHILYCPVDGTAQQAHHVISAVQYYTNPTTFNSQIFSGELAGADAINYFRIKKNSATSWDFAVSADGQAWVTLAAGVNIGTFLTPDQIGFGCDHRTRAPSLGLHHFRVQ